LKNQNRSQKNVPTAQASFGAGTPQCSTTAAQGKIHFFGPLAERRNVINENFIVWSDRLLEKLFSHRLIESTTTYSNRMSPNRLVAFCGAAKSGKTVSADFLVQWFGFRKVKFADLIKDMLGVLGLTDMHLEGVLKEAPLDWLGGKSPRYLMQTLGTEWGRNLITADIWANAWAKRVQELLDGGFDVVVDDCRFPNEADTIRRMGGTIVEIVRPGVDGVLPHSSEQQVIAADRTILNENSIRDLYLQLQKLL
jgi:hypothetical protein